MIRGAARVLAILLLALLSASSGTASAQGTANVAKAKTLFKAGAQAYADSDFKAALQAFDAARAIVPDPALTFSIAQAHRRQYHLMGNLSHLRQAVTEYRRYLTEVHKGGRRGDATEALAQLVPKLQERLGDDQPVEAPARLATRLMVLSSVEGAQVTVDDGPPESAPFIGEVEPGNHAVQVVAPGYRPYLRTVPVRAGSVAAVDAKLEDLPAQLLVRGAAGATLWIDGRPLGFLPLRAPVAVPPGRRLVSVTQDGYGRFELETHLGRAEHKELDVALEATAQRSVGIATLVLAGSSLIAGGVFGGVAAATYDDTKAIYDKWEVQNILEDERAVYAESQDAHEPWMVAAIATGAAGLGLGLAGGLLLLLDQAVTPSLVDTARADRVPPRLRVIAAPSPQGGHFGVSLRF